MPELTPLPPDYAAWLSELKTRIHSAQQRATLAVNRELVLLYWQIGQDILARQNREGWGTKVIERLAQDLRNAFPDMKGFSPRNLKYMRAFAEAWPDSEFVQQAAAQLLSPAKSTCANSSSPNRQRALPMPDIVQLPADFAAWLAELKTRSHFMQAVLAQLSNGLLDNYLGRLRIQAHCGIISESFVKLRKALPFFSVRTDPSAALRTKGFVGG